MRRVSGLKDHENIRKEFRYGSTINITTTSTTSTRSTHQLLQPLSMHPTNPKREHPLLLPTPSLLDPLHCLPYILHIRHTGQSLQRPRGQRIHNLRIPHNPFICPRPAVLKPIRYPHPLCQLVDRHRSSPWPQGHQD